MLMKKYHPLVRKTALFFSCIFSLLVKINAQNIPANSVLGTWVKDDKTGRIEIYQSGNTYLGKLLWGKYMFDEKGIPRKDTRNPNTALRNREWQNMVMLTGFQYKNGQWEGGEVYDPTTGKSYQANMKVRHGRLEIRGYVGISLLGKTIYWDRVK
jgi:uncharacterized protein (DUF2147 family)